MSDERKRRPKARLSLWTAAILLMYVLSTGPVCRARGHNDLDIGWTAIAYAPICWASGSCRPINEGIAWYTGLWMPPCNLRIG
jgi:hypothetical protein